MKHLQYASLVDVEKISGGKLNVPHFTDKAKVWDYILSKKDKFESVHSVAGLFCFRFQLC